MKEIPLESVTLGFLKDFCRSGMVGIVDGDKKVLRVEEGVGPWLLYPEAPVFEAGDFGVPHHQSTAQLFVRRRMLGIWKRQEGQMVSAQQ